MWNKILNFFGYANDWILIWEEQGSWEVTTDSFSKVTRKANYSIEQSKSLKKNRLKISGYKPEHHAVHLVARMQLIHFNKEFK